MCGGSRNVYSLRPCCCLIISKEKGHYAELKELSWDENFEDENFDDIQFFVDYKTIEYTYTYLETTVL